MKHMFPGDFSMNVLDYKNRKKVKSFFDLMYPRNLLPTINKPTRTEKKLATATDHITTAYVLTCDLKTTILETDLTDHFPNDGPSQQRSETKHL